MAPFLGAAALSGNGAIVVIGVASLASATSTRDACRTWVTATSKPTVVWVRSVRPTVAMVAYGVAPLTRLPRASWKQWPAVMIHCGAMRAAEHALSYVVPSVRGMPVIVSFVENGYFPSGTGLPLATAFAGPEAVSTRARPATTTPIVAHSERDLITDIGEASTGGRTGPTSARTVGSADQLDDQRPLARPALDRRGQRCDLDLHALPAGEAAARPVQGVRMPLVGLDQIARAGAVRGHRRHDDVTRQLAGVGPVWPVGPVSRDGPCLAGRSGCGRLGPGWRSRRAPPRARRPRSRLSVARRHLPR